jgi:hypothetical protein
MRITWKDGVTALAVAGAIVIERAYFHGWDWPLVSSLRWAITGILVMGVITYVFGYLLADRHGEESHAFANAVGLSFIGFYLLGLAAPDNDYAVIAMLGVVLFGLASILRHLFGLPSDHLRGQTPISRGTA